MAIRYLPVFSGKNEDPNDPVLQIIPLSLVKTHLRVQYDDDDDYITMLIRNAVDIANQFTGLSLIPGLKYFNSKVFEKEYRIYDSVNSIQTISYKDVLGQVVSVDLETVTITSFADHFLLEFSEIPEDVNITNANVKVMYNSGQQSVEDFSLQGSILQAILLIVGEFYEYREDRVWNMPRASERLLAPFRVLTF